VNNIGETSEYARSRREREENSTTITPSDVSTDGIIKPHSVAVAVLI
jgi:hypothetical protein